MAADATSDAPSPERLVVEVQDSRDIGPVDVAADHVLLHPVANLGREEGRPQPLQRCRRHRIAGETERQPRLIAVVEPSGQRDRHAFVQLAAEFLCSPQISDMAYVEQIEVSVGQRDAFAGATPILDATAELITAENLAVPEFAVSVQ